MNCISKVNYFYIASSLVLLAIFFDFHGTFAQTPKLFLKFAEKQNQVQSGYAKWQYLSMTNNDIKWLEVEEIFFISTPKDLKYSLYHQSRLDSNVYCKSAHTLVYAGLCNEYTNYYDDIDAKDRGELKHPAIKGVSVHGMENHLFQRIPPKINKKNIRYKIMYPDQKQNFLTNISQEWEFDRKTFHCFQIELSVTYFNIDAMYNRIDILEQRLYDYIHPDILDTISFKFDEIKRKYDKQTAKKDSVFRAHLCDSIAQSFTKTGGTWTENIPQDVKKDSLFFMPKWKFPLLSGDSIYSDSINSQFLLIDMWYVSCHPCRLAMVELASIDTLYNETLLKVVSINVLDEDTIKITQLIRKLNLQCDVACAYRSDEIYEMSKKMGDCRGYPQLYLIEMKTKQVIWHSCGYYKGFTKDIEEKINKEK